jgi:hypothetical protein
MTTLRVSDRHTGLTFRGKEIVLSKKTGPKKGGLVGKGIQKGMYPDEMKLKAVTVYAATGNIEKVSEISGVPYHTVRAWRNSEWFQGLLREVWQENNEKIDAKFTAIVEKSLDEVLDRLENGDVRLSKDGKVVRVPISAKDLSLVSAINVDKRQLLRGLPTSRSESVDSASSRTVDRLEKLAETFESLAKFGRKTETIDITEAQLTHEALPAPESTSQESVETILDEIEQADGEGFNPSPQ